MNRSRQGLKSPVRTVPARTLVACTAFLALVSGCKKPQQQLEKPRKEPVVSIVNPTKTSLRWTIRQPGTVEAFEETAIFPKIAGYVEKWNVDIGDRVKKGDVLAMLWVPDLAKDLEQRKAESEQARKMLDVAEAHLASTTALIGEAEATLKRAEANLRFRRMQHDRVSQLLQRSVVNKEVEDESSNEVQAAEADVKEGTAKLAHAHADSKESEAVREKSRVDIDVARAALGCSQSFVDFASLRAPFDGIVTRRRISTGDFVQPPGGPQSEPLYVVQRRDVMRIFVEVPEADAVWVKDGITAHIHMPTLKGIKYAGAVKRVSYALKRQSRTLLAEVDLPNPDDLLRSGMFAATELIVVREKVRTLPNEAVATQGDVNEGFQDYCFMLEGDKVVQTQVEVGMRGDGRLEVLKKRVRGIWVDFTGEEKVVVGGISKLSNNQKVSTRKNVERASRTTEAVR